MPANKPSNRNERAKTRSHKGASGECRAFADIIGLAFSNRHLNPYVTLAYERLIRGRGHEIGPDIAAAPDLAHAAPEEVIHPDPQEGNDNSAN